MTHSTRGWRGRKGGALILFTLMLPTIIVPMVGLAIDGTMLYTVRAKLSAAVDGGAIAAARSLSAGLSFEEQKAAATKTAQQFVRANFPEGFWGARSLSFDNIEGCPDPGICVQEDTKSAIKRRTVEIQAAVQVPLLFMRILGGDLSTVRARSMAARRDVRLVLVLDRSNSMSHDMDELRSAATDFVNMFSEGRDRVGLVVYGATAIVAFPPRDPAIADGGGTGPASDFKTASPSVPSLISDKLNYCCATGMAEALALAWRELKKNPLPGALNLIVLFTDGQPSAVNIYANNPAENVMKATSGCVNKARAAPTEAQKIIGALSMVGSGESIYYSGTSARGLYRDMQKTLNGTDPDVVRWVEVGEYNEGDPISTTEGGYGSGAGSRTEGCAAIDTPNTSVSADLQRLPTRDYYGNATNSASISQAKYFAMGGGQNLSLVTSNYQIYLASWSAADSAGASIRNDADLTPVIYTIGLTDKVDHVLLRRLANVNHPTNTSYDATKPSGVYENAPNPAQLAAAFAKVASEILRLTN